MDENPYSSFVYCEQRDKTLTNVLFTTIVVFALSNMILSIFDALHVGPPEDFLFECIGISACLHIGNMLAGLLGSNASRIMALGISAFCAIAYALYLTGDNDYVDSAGQMHIFFFPFLLLPIATILHLGVRCWPMP